MCFSPEVDIAAGVVVGAVGLDALRHVDTRRELPLAALPIILGGHLLIEAFVWWGLDGQVSQDTFRTALWAYIAIAYVLLPALAPLAVAAVEPDPANRRAVSRFAVLGVLVAAFYAASMADGSIDAFINDDKIAYQTGVPEGGVVAVLYMLATVGAFLCSSHRRLVSFGVANIIALPVLTLVSTEALASLWCAWAAVASVVIALHLRTQEAMPDDAEPGPHRRPVAALAAGWMERVRLGPR
jgi:hypothetical protein